MTDMKIDVAITERARAGATLTETELLALESADLLSLGMLADEHAPAAACLRRRGVDLEVVCERLRRDVRAAA